MKIKTKALSSVSAETDMTPMIDMTFQLIAFFMFVLNFADAEVNERIRLPLSQLVKPPEKLLETPITLQVTKNDTVLFAGDEIPVAGLKRYLLQEEQVLNRQGKDVANANIIVRADEDARTGKVQEIIKLCQEAGFEKFSLRAKQQELPSKK